MIEAGGDGHRAPMIWSGGMAWIADFPDPSNFYGPILGCAGAGEGGWNWSKYCNEELDAKAAAADSMSDPAKAAERWRCGRTSTRRSWTTRPGRRSSTSSASPMRSPRMGGETNLYVDPVQIPINYDYIYVTE